MFDAAKLRRLRESRSWTQAQAAAAAGLPMPTYADLEAGRTADPNYSTVQKLAACFGVDCGAFGDLPATSEPPPPKPRGRPRKSDPAGGVVQPPGRPKKAAERVPSPRPPGLHPEEQP